LNREFICLFVFLILFSAIIAFTDKWVFFTTVAFVIGSITSIICGYIGMTVATRCNVRVAFLAASFSQPEEALSQAFSVAFRGGCVMGFVLVSLALGMLTIMISVYTRKLFVLIIRFIKSKRFEKLHTHVPLYSRIRFRWISSCFIL
jgi:inorganic pyrophosphatase